MSFLLVEIRALVPAATREIGGGGHYQVQHSPRSMRLVHMFGVHDAERGCEI